MTNRKPGSGRPPAGRVLMAPSVLSADFAKLGDDIRLIEEAGADLLHVDVMDGHFVPNITLGPFIVEALNRLTDLFLDVHLMIEEPGKYADAFIKAGSDRLIVQIETVDEPRPLLAKIREAGCEAALVLNPETPFDRVEPFLDAVDLLLVMSVHPGFGGQRFIPDVLEKVKKACALRESRGLDFAIEIDGGINASTVVDAARAGVDVFVAGNAVFGAADPAAALREIRVAAESVTLKS